jgi:hypothetical protein
MLNRLISSTNIFVGELERYYSLAGTDNIDLGLAGFLILVYKVKIKMIKKNW